MLYSTGACTIKHYGFIIYGKLTNFLMFAGKARAYLSEASTFQVLHTRVGSYPLPQTLDD
jgi:hypothetical protein